MQQFEKKVLDSFTESGFIKGKKLMVDATVFPANIAYPNDVKRLNTI